MFPRRKMMPRALHSAKSTRARGRCWHHWRRRRPSWSPSWRRRAPRWPSGCCRRPGCWENCLATHPRKSPPRTQHRRKYRWAGFGAGMLPCWKHAQQLSKPNFSVREDRTFSPLFGCDATRGRFVPCPELSLALSERVAAVHFFPPSFTPLLRAAPRPLIHVRERVFAGQGDRTLTLES